MDHRRGAEGYVPIHDRVVTDVPTDPARLGRLALIAWGRRCDHGRDNDTGALSCNFSDIARTGGSGSAC
jgi:hypothetical protein